jgi:hypothetical protein
VQSPTLDIEGTLFRAALLAHHGREAATLAARLASVSKPTGGRSCVEAGSPLQITVDAPGEASLRVALRLGADAENLSRLLEERTAQTLAHCFSPLPPPDYPSIGFWLFWSSRRQSLFADLRDPDPARALERLRMVLDTEEQRRLTTILALAVEGRPWGVSAEVDETNLRRLHLYWMVSRPTSASQLVEAFAPGGWNEVVQVLSHLLKRPGESGRWMLVIPLDADPHSAGISVGSSAWALVPEDESKHRAVGRIMAALGGPRDYAEAMWSFCRGAAGPGWRVGRTCEVGLGAGVPRVRLFLSPQVQPAATAGINSSESVDSSTGPVEADPSSAYRTTR